MLEGSLREVEDLKARIWEKKGMKMNEIRIERITKYYGEKAVLRSVSMRLPPGGRVCLMGPSGSGKTTLFRILMGLETADEGEITVLGRDIAGREPQEGNAATREGYAGGIVVRGLPEGNASALRNARDRIRAERRRPDWRIGAVFQEDRLLEELTAVENVRLAAEPAWDDARISRELLRILPEEALRKPVKEQSGGMKRRIALARAVLAPADLLLLDEPFTGLDEETKRNVIRWLLEKQGERTLLFSSHQEEDALLAGADVVSLPDLSASMKRVPE